MFVYVTILTDLVGVSDSELRLQTVRERELEHDFISGYQSYCNDWETIEIQRQLQEVQSTQRTMQNEVEQTLSAKAI